MSTKKIRAPKKLTDLSGADYNPREISDRAVSGLKGSIEEFGDISGITFNTRTGNLVSGHQRVEQLHKLYGDLKFKDGLIITPKGDSFGVRLVDWPLEKEKAANITANNGAISGTFTSAVYAILEEIKLSFPEQYGVLNLDDIHLLPLPNISSAKDNPELDETFIEGLGLHAYFKITLPLDESEQLDKDLIKLLKKYPNASKEKRV